MSLKMLGAVVVFVFGFAVPAPPVAAAPPDTSLIVSVVGPESVAHSCPISARTAVTARHVAVAEENGAAQPQSYRGESIAWRGLLRAYSYADHADIGFLSVSTPFQSWYTVRPSQPRVGERLWWMGFDWRSANRYAQRRVFTGRVTSTIAGSIILDVPTPNGSSGSCVLDASGMVVGVIAWTMRAEDGKGAAIAVGMQAPWYVAPKEPTP